METGKDKDMKVLELFAGIGACSKALERIGIDLEIVDAVEIDKYAIASFNAIHNTNFEVQDIKEWNKDLKDVDLITHGSPCQDFSVAGKQAGGDINSGTRSSLMYETIRIVGKLRPKYVLWENVKNLLSKKHKHNFDAYIETMNILGYNSYYEVLNAKDYGIPQNRERVYTISIRKDIDKGNFKFPEKEELKLRLKDLLEDEVDEKYYLSNKGIDYVLKRDGGYTQLVDNKTEVAHCPITALGNTNWTGNFIKIKTANSTSILEDGFVEKKYNNFIKEKGYIPEMFNPYNGSEIKEIAPTQSTQCGSMTSSATVMVLGNYMPSNHDASRVVDSNGLAPTVKENHGTVTATNIDYRIRKLTPKECWRLMGFDDEDFEKAKDVPTSNTQLYKQAGNSIVVNVLEKIFKNLFLK